MLNTGRFTDLVIETTIRAVRGALTIGDVVFDGTVTMAAPIISGAISAASLAVTGAVQGASAAFTGAVTAASLALTGNATAARLVSGLGTAALPGVALGDGDTGMYEAVDDFAIMSVAGVAYQQWASSETQPLVKFTLANRFALGNVIASALTGSVNNHAPTGITTCNGVRFTSDGAYNVTGLQGGFTGGLLMLINASAFTLTLVHASGSSSAGNQFLCPGAANFSLTANSIVQIWYDAASLSWRVLG